MHIYRRASGLPTIGNTNFAASLHSCPPHTPTTMSHLRLGALAPQAKTSASAKLHCCTIFWCCFLMLFMCALTLLVRAMRLEWPAAAASHMYHPIVYEEEVPYTDNISYLAAVSKSVYGAIATVDPEAVWLVQVRPYQPLSSLLPFPSSLLSLLLSSLTSTYRLVLCMSWCADF